MQTINIKIKTIYMIKTHDKLNYDFLNSIFYFYFIICEIVKLNM